MAATFQGAANRPESTSVRYVVGTQNGAAGGAFGGFTEKQRLFDHQVLSDDFWVFVK
jgi:hypothetical protein